MTHHLFPLDPDESKNAFLEARAFFNENPHENKYKRSKFFSKKNSFIKDNNDNIYMLALSEKAEKEALATSYLGRGSYAKVKKGIDEKAVPVAVRIQRKEIPFPATFEIACAEKVGLTQGLLFRKTDSSKTLGKKDCINYFGGNFKEYQIQKVTGIPLLLFLMSKKNILQSDERFRIAVRVIQKISELHRMNIAHLDIKPGNLMIDPLTHEITVIDYGFSEAKINDALFIKKGTPFYLPAHPVGMTKQEIDLHALIKTLFFPICDDSSVFLDVYPKPYAPKQNEFFCVLNHEDVGSYALLYKITKLTHYFILTQNNFSSCDDLAIKLIMAYFGVKNIFDDFSSEDKVLFISRIEQMLSLAILDRRSLSSKQIVGVAKNIGTAENDKHLFSQKKYLFKINQNHLIISKTLKNIQSAITIFSKKSFSYALFSGAGRNFEKLYAHHYGCLLRDADNLFKKLVILYACMKGRKIHALKKIVLDEFKYDACDIFISDIKAFIAGEIQRMAIISGVGIAYAPELLSQLLMEIEETILPAFAVVQHHENAYVSKDDPNLFGNALTLLMTLEEKMINGSGEAQFYGLRALFA